MSPTKRKTPSQADAKVLEITGRVKKQIDKLSASAQGRAARHGAWVADKVRRAMVRIEHAIGK